MTYPNDAPCGADLPRACRGLRVRATPIRAAPQGAWSSTHNRSATTAGCMRAQASRAMKLRTATAAKQRTMAGSSPARRPQPRAFRRLRAGRRQAGRGPVARRRPGGYPLRNGDHRARLVHGHGQPPRRPSQPPSVGPEPGTGQVRAGVRACPGRCSLRARRSNYPLICPCGGRGPRCCIGGKGRPGVPAVTCEPRRRACGRGAGR
jgi:hypothetical protein